MKTSERMRKRGWHQPFADVGRMTWHAMHAGFRVMVNDGRDDGNRNLATYTVSDLSRGLFLNVGVPLAGVRNLAQRAEAAARKLARGRSGK